MAGNDGWQLIITTSAYGDIMEISGPAAAAARANTQHYSDTLRFNATQLQSGWCLHQYELPPAILVLRAPCHNSLHVSSAQCQLCLVSSFPVVFSVCSSSKDCHHVTCPVLASVPCCSITYYLVLRVLAMLRAK